MSVGLAWERRWQEWCVCDMQFWSKGRGIHQALKSATDNTFIKEQNDMSWAETHICLDPCWSLTDICILHSELKIREKIYKSSCLKESSWLWPFLSLLMNDYHPVSFIYLWWEFRCDWRSLWHGSQVGPTLGNDFRSEFLTTATVVAMSWSERRGTRQEALTQGGDIWQGHRSQVIASITRSWTVK